MLPTVPKSREFSRLWAAATISQVGDWSARLAVAALVLSVTGDPVWVGVVAAVFITPSIGIGQFLTGWAERFTRRSVLIGCDSLRAVVFAFIAIVDLGPAALLIAVAVAAAADPVFEANIAAAIHDNLDDSNRDDGVRLKWLTSLLAQIAGTAAAGIALRWISPQGIIAVNAGTFVVSSLIISRLPRLARPERTQHVGGVVLAAARTVVGNPHMLAALSVAIIAMFGAMTLEAQMVVVADGQPAWVLPAGGILLPLGAAVSIAVVPTVGDSRQVLHRSLFVATAAAFLAAVAMETGHPIGVAAAFGFGGVMFHTSNAGNIVAARHLPVEGRAPVINMLQTFVFAGMAISGVISGVVLAAFGVFRGVQICVAVVLLAWFVPVPRGGDPAMPGSEV